MSSPISYDLQGQGGGIVLADGDTANGKFRWIQVINDTEFADLQSNNIEDLSNLAGKIFVAGLGIGGDFTVIEIATGLVIAYYA